MKPGDLRAVYAHSDVARTLDSLAQPLADVAKWLLDAWRTAVTAGSRVKALRHTPGNDYRLRIGKVRVVFSVEQGVAYIHLAGKRDQVYEDDGFRIRLQRFVDECGIGNQFNDRAPCQLGYASVPIHSVEPKTARAVHDSTVSIGYELRKHQRHFFSSVLPLEGREHAAPHLTIGHGPPGSGKTIVGLELAIEAVADGHSVDILVPSRSLLDWYRRQLISSGIPLVDAHEDRPAARVRRFDSWFAERAGLHLPVDREGQVLAWAESRLRQPKLASRIPTIGAAVDSDRLEELLPRLTDALLHDDSWWSNFEVWSSRRKDGIVSSIRPYLKVLQSLRATLLHEFEVGGARELRTRSELALAPQHQAHKAARVTIVDEAQDLAPAEWRGLIESTFNLPTSEDRLVMLGDMQQRVSLVPFDWSDVKRHAFESCKLRKENICERVIDNASYRMSMGVASAAEAVFHPRVRPHDATRARDKPDPERLRQGGKVFVAVVDSDADVKAIEAEIERVARDSAIYERRHLFCVHGKGVGQRLTGISGMLNHSVQEAKGLEAPGVLVNLPFGTVGRRSAAGIEFADATAYYTAVSRARDNVLLIIDSASWELISRAESCWANSSIGRGAALTAPWIRDALASIQVSLSVDEIREFRLDQLERLCDASPPTADEPFRRRVEEALDALAAIVTDEVIWKLPNLGSMLAENQPTAFDALRERYQARQSALDASARVAYLLFFGEFASARRIANSGDANVDADTLQLLSEDSAIQTWMWSYASRQPEYWADRVGASQLVGELLERLESPQVGCVTDAEVSLFQAAANWRQRTDYDTTSAIDQRIADYASRFAMRVLDELTRVQREAFDSAISRLRARVAGLEQRSARLLEATSQASRT